MNNIGELVAVLVVVSWAIISSVGVGIVMYTYTNDDWASFFVALAWLIGSWYSLHWAGKEAGWDKN